MTRVYTSGVFDLFHVGHLRALEKAKAQGDYLLVGVSRDDDAASYKRAPVIPFSQRIEILRGLSCVDEAIECPKYPTPEFYQQHAIELHVQGDDPAGHDFYRVADDLGILRIVGRDDSVDSSSIVCRILASGSS